MIEENKNKKLKNQRRPRKKRDFSEKINHKVVQIKRVSKVVKGGKKMSFRAVVVVGIDGRTGFVGIGTGKADDVTNAINKAVAKGKRNLINIPITKTETIPHSVTGIFGASNVIIRPSAPGSGVIAGSSIRTVLEVAGIRNVLAKQLGSSNLLNNAKATINGLNQLKTISQVAQERDIAVDLLYQN
jgi:small subunit ribosomal protein S5|uniref:Small ribosomal subunit protein uS5c n=2 Tax=Heterosigma akashiwo TaxID=2829 RepID=B2XTD9_HETAK|nr:ribosomal protein S5 [Heterosigma akashiwo]ABV66037.1 30S ribosomal protein S5 [Heterosigma akashiwo]ABV70178.1 30S ribosomal protein S5 [Heterosigma akashiwo]BBA18243.1 30S ribosomal protein S5 [Heterosigma akashiwo]BBA18382.1 30S ribosomal protein S5 [Heterosigma akashiwo]BBA18521.1 30S ribosomal protein S5 [Heterosigma akashiwo]|mmetsp:Transcript_19614/g.29671  ORF Transcript_19614/g.29671 Transcript_19614/m.29671 type:complete len:186 (-) Transcript_19614:7855-8412(-)